MDITAHIQEEFADARSGLTTTRRVERILRDQGFHPDTTLMATSTCPDELNRSVTGLARRWGPAFPLGGLAGLPFTGQTGFDAYYSHLPDPDGAGLIVYGSHVGVTDEGAWGRVVRPGQRAATLCCGSAMGALELLDDGRSAEDAESQQQVVTQLLEERREEIEDGEHAGAEAARVLAGEIGERLDELLPDAPDRVLVCLGGIQINTPSGEEDYFVARELTLYRPDEEEPTDLLGELVD